jgi:hypothetical protein
MRKSMGRSLAKELNCQEKIERPYEKALPDPQQGGIIGGEDIGTESLYQ